MGATLKLGIVLALLAPCVGLGQEIVLKGHVTDPLMLNKEVPALDEHSGFDGPAGGWSYDLVLFTIF